MAWESEKVEANGITLNVHRTGNGDKPSLVMLHGITDDGLCWTRSAHALEDEYDIVMIDARGHGDSDKPVTGYRPGDHAADLAGVITRLDLKRPTLVGHSMGGMVAAHAAAMYPQHLRGICLLDPPFRDPHTALGEEERKKWREEITQRNGMTIEDLAQLMAAAGWDETDLKTWAVSKQKVSPEVVEYTASAHTPWRELLPRIELPVLLMTGDVEKGAIITPEIAEEAVSLLVKGKLHPVNGVGHNIQREHFADYMAALREFLGELK
jgi:pimeloyl-ACP methyl ester carboxylesterase